MNANSGLAHSHTVVDANTMVDCSAWCWMLVLKVWMWRVAWSATSVVRRALMKCGRIFLDEGRRAQECSVRAVICWSSILTFLQVVSCSNRVWSWRCYKQQFSQPRLAERVLRDAALECENNKLYKCYWRAGQMSTVGREWHRGSWLPVTIEWLHRK